MTDLRSLPRDRILAAMSLPTNASPAAQKALRDALGLQGHKDTSIPANVAQKGSSEAREHVALVLPLPPSVNSYWRSVPATRNRIARVLISEQGRRFKRACRTAAAAQCKSPLDGDVSLRCVVYFKDRRRDLDNVCKPLLDALNGVAYGDDRQIVHIELTKRLDPKRPRVEVTLEAHP
jgi:crossover junction endodeoxyribonuclease RusA